MLTTGKRKEVSKSTKDRLAKSQTTTFHSTYTKLQQCELAGAKVLVASRFATH